MIGIVRITVLAAVGLMGNVIGVIIRDPLPPPVHMLLQKLSSEPFNEDFQVINFKIFVPKKSSSHKTKVVDYKKKWNSTGMPKSFKQIFDFYRHEGNYYPNEKKITTVPPAAVTENTLSSVVLFPASYHSKVHHDNQYDSFSDGSIVKPVSEDESEGYFDKDDGKHFTTNSTQQLGDGSDDYTDDEGNTRKQEKYNRYYQ